jgi:hypothetical protein
MAYVEDLGLYRRMLMILAMKMRRMKIDIFILNQLQVMKAMR